MARTPTKATRFTEFVPPSPKSLMSMYDYNKRQHEELKNDVKMFMKRLLIHCKPQSVSDIILEEEPLHKLYEFFVEASKTKNIPVIVLSDSSVRQAGGSASVCNGGDGAGDDNGGSGEDMLDDGNSNEGGD